LNRVEVLAQVDDGRLSVDNAANMLDLTRRQIFRLLKRYRQDGAPAIRHKARGKSPNNLIHQAKRDYALSLIKENYPDFGPTLAAGMLAEHHGFRVSRETLRKWMQEDGLWLPRKQRRRFHQRRLRRECFGELIQIDGSDHRWFEERANRILQDRLVKGLRLAGISDMGAGNAYPQGFKERFNTQSAKAPAKPDNLHRVLNDEPNRLDAVRCSRDPRYVGKQLTFSYDRKRIILEESEVTRGLLGKYVDTYAFVDGRFEVRSKGRSPPYKIFDMDQRVTHAAITNNKRLGAVLEHIKDMQDKASSKYPEEELEIIMFDLCADVEIDGHFLTVDIYKSDVDPGWILQVINEFGTSTVFDDPFLAAGLARQQFEKAVKEEGLAAFLTKKERRQLLHLQPQGLSTLRYLRSPRC